MDLVTISISITIMAQESVKPSYFNGAMYYAIFRYRFFRFTQNKMHSSDKKEL